MFIDQLDMISFFFKRLRIISRFMLVGYAVILHIMINWVLGLPDITTAQAIITSVMVTMATPLTKFYIDSGNNLYDTYDDMIYSNRIVKYIDMAGYVTDRLRLVPVGFIIHFTVSLVILLFWAFGLGEALTVSQATFISIYAGNASMILGFYITTDSNNRDSVSSYKKRMNIMSDIRDNSNVVNNSNLIDVVDKKKEP